MYISTHDTHIGMPVSAHGKCQYGAILKKKREKQTETVLIMINGWVIFG